MVASINFYKEYLAYIQDTDQESCYLNHNRFTNVLKKHFGIVAKPMKIPIHGLCQIIQFQDLLCDEHATEIGEDSVGEEQSHDEVVDFLKETCSEGKDVVMYASELLAAFKQYSLRKEKPFESWNVTSFGLRIKEIMKTYNGIKRTHHKHKIRYTIRADTFAV